METFIIFIFDIIYLILAPKIGAFLASWFNWAPSFIFKVVFPLLVFFDFVNRSPEILEKLNIWNKKQ